MDSIHIRDAFVGLPFVARALVMDDYHGRIELNLDHHQLPHCPCIIHTTIEVIIAIIIILQVAIFHWLMSFPRGIFGVV